MFSNLISALQKSGAQSQWNENSLIAGKWPASEVSKVCASTIELPFTFTQTNIQLALPERATINLIGR